MTQIRKRVTNISQQPVIIINRTLLPGELEFFLHADLVQHSRAYELELDGILLIEDDGAAYGSEGGAPYTETIFDSGNYPTKATGWASDAKGSLLSETLFTYGGEGRLSSKIIKLYSGNSATPTVETLIQTEVHTYDSTDLYNIKKTVTII